MKTFCCDDCALCCNRDKAGVWAMTAGLMMYSVAGLYSRRSFWPFISLSPLPVTVITSRNESCASRQSALLWNWLGGIFSSPHLTSFPFLSLFFFCLFPLPHCPSPVFLPSLIVFQSLFISPFLFQFYLFNWFVCFTRQEMHSSHSLGRLHITHFGNGKSRSPHIWSASLCVSAVQVRWFKRWLTVMMDLQFLLLISAVHNNVLTKYESGLEVARGLFTVTHAILGEHSAAKWRSCFTGTESKKNKKKDLRHI